MTRPLCLGCLHPTSELASDSTCSNVSTEVPAIRMEDLESGLDPGFSLAQPWVLLAIEQ